MSESVNKRKKILKWITLGLITGVLVIVPWFFRTFAFQNLMITIFINITLALSLWIMILAGEPSFGQSGFAAVGGYTTAILTTRYGIEAWLTFPLGALVGMVVALLLGLVIAHLEGVFFMITTFAFMSLLFGLTMNFRVPFGSADGIMGVPPPSGLAAVFGDLGIGFYFLALILMVITILATLAITQSRPGILFQAIEENKILSAHSGINVRKYKLQAMAIGCFFTGLAGSINACYMEQICPYNFGFLQSLDIVLFCHVGGISSIFGPITGAVVLTFLSLYFLALGPYRMIVYGGVLAIVILLLRGGLISLPEIVTDLVKRFKKSKTKIDIAVEETEAM
ncbi:MAG: branched-chain amino acid ABC transporter permease [Candidatus Hodarchaeota archaeon]